MSCLRSHIQGVRPVLGCLLLLSCGKQPQPVAELAEETTGANPVLVQRSLPNPSTQCPNTVIPEPSEHPPTDSKWLIHSGGVGSISPDGPLSPVVLEMEGKNYKELVLAPLKAMDDYKAMEEGLIDQEGFRTLQMTSLDLTIRINRNRRVMNLYPGPTLKTKHGVGIGSTLGQLNQAHGNYTLNRIPEPYHCAVSLQHLDKVYFYFDTCEAACSGGKVKRIYMPGNDPWGEEESGGE